MYPSVQEDEDDSCGRRSTRPCSPTLIPTLPLSYPIIPHHTPSYPNLSLALHKDHDASHLSSFEPLHPFPKIHMPDRLFSKGGGRFIVQL